MRTKTDLKKTSRSDQPTREEWRVLHERQYALRKAHLYFLIFGLFGVLIFEILLYFFPPKAPQIPPHYFLLLTVLLLVGIPQTCLLLKDLRLRKRWVSVVRKPPEAGEK
jgi:hypothetical protein